MSLLNVLEEGRGPLQGGRLVRLGVAERDQEVQLVTADADPAPPTLIQTCSGKALFLLPRVCLVDSISC